MLKYVKVPVNPNPNFDKPCAFILEVGGGDNKLVILQKVGSSAAYIRKIKQTIEKYSNVKYVRCKHYSEEQVSFKVLSDNYAIPLHGSIDAAICEQLEELGAVC